MLGFISNFEPQQTKSTKITIRGIVRVDFTQVLCGVTYA